MALVEYQKSSPLVGRITLNDPDNLNAMGEAMAKEFADITAQIGRERPRALILTGAGRAFSAGGDLAMLKGKTQLSREENHRRMLAFYNSFLGILELDVPMIAAINGHAIGAGLCVACACDIRVAATNAKFGFTFTKLGLHPGMASTYAVRNVLGVSGASELLLTGKIIEAEEALRIGLVSTLTAPDALLAHAQATADAIALNGPECIQQLVRSLRYPPKNLAEALQREADCQSINYASAEFKEGITAALEKRAPKF